VTTKAKRVRVQKFWKKVVVKANAKGRRNIAALKKMVASKKGVHAAAWANKFAIAKQRAAKWKGRFNSKLTKFSKQNALKLRGWTMRHSKSFAAWAKTHRGLYKGWALKHPRRFLKGAYRFRCWRLKQIGQKKCNSQVKKWINVVINCRKLCAKKCHARPYPHHVLRRKSSRLAQQSAQEPVPQEE